MAVIQYMLKGGLLMLLVQGLDHIEENIRLLSERVPEIPCDLVALEFARRIFTSYRWTTIKPSVRVLLVSIERLKTTLGNQ